VEPRGRNRWQPVANARPPKTAQPLRWLRVHTFYGETVPDSVVDWLRDAFPDAQVRLAGAE